MVLTPPLSAAWPVKGLIPPTLSAYVDAALDYGSAATGNALTPFSTLQAAYDSGAKNLICAPGTYGNLVVAAGDFVVVSGNQIDTLIGNVSSSGGTSLIFEKMVHAGTVGFTDNNTDNFAFFSQCELAQTPTTFSGGTIAAQATAQFALCDFGDVLTLANWRRFLLDSYSEWQFLAAGGKVTPIASRVDVLGTGLEGNGTVLNDANGNLASGVTGRYILPTSTMTASRSYSLTTGAVSDVVEVYSYNNSGFSALFKSGATTLATDVSLAHVSLYRFKCTVADTTWILDSHQRLG